MENTFMREVVELHDKYMEVSWGMLNGVHTFGICVTCKAGC